MLISEDDYSIRVWICKQNGSEDHFHCKAWLVAENTAPANSSEQLNCTMKISRGSLCIEQIVEICYLTLQDCQEKNWTRPQIVCVARQLLNWSLLLLPLTPDHPYTATGNLTIYTEIWTHICSCHNFPPPPLLLCWYFWYQLVAYCVCFNRMCVF